jgi:NAD(P)-dependent dehydrogenase (short-subunit alcohol dehydrogenase family)
MSPNASATHPVVAITGGARGIGLATARALHATGARVAIGDVDEAAALQAAADLGSDAVAAHLDVSDEASFAAFLAFAEQELGSVDVLVNNAGIMPIGPFLDEPIATARRAVDVNLVGCLTGMKAALPAMLARGHGQIVNVASVAGKAPVPGGLTYAATKAAVISMTETARVEFTGRGVDFTCVMPSFTNTELIAGTKGTRFVKNVEPEDVAQAIVAAIRRPRADVYVPRALAGIVRTQPLLGRRLRDALNRVLKADRTFLEVDQGARAAYDRRIAAPAEPAQLDAPADTPDSARVPQ